MKHVTTKHIYACDFETTVYEGQIHTEVWSSAMVELGSEDVKLFGNIKDTFEYIYHSKRPWDEFILYYHNLKFDGAFIVDWLLKNRFTFTDNHKAKERGTFNTVISDMGQWYMIVVNYKGVKITIRDSLKLFPFTLKQVGKAFNTKHQKTDMEYTNKFSLDDCSECDIEYIKNDVLVLKEALEFMFGEGHDRLTIGSCCLAEYKNLIGSDWDNWFPDLTEYILATLFYEPSTRTRLSFESAMLRLGGKVLGFPDAGVSSASKGETVADTIRIISCYADIAAMRHPKEGAPLRASLYSKIPVINAGDGGHSHPTQTLLDMMTIRRRKGRLDNLTIGFCGDLKFGRTVHSLIKSLARYDNVKFVLISPEELRVPDYIINEVLEPRGIPYIETRNLEGALPDLDILYMTRVQRERFFNEEDYIRLRDSYILTAEKLNLAPADMAVLHPLPRVNEITLDVDDDPRAAYFEQAQNGVYVRMALIMTLLGLKDPKTGEVAFEC
mgnify:CR=1 FL=1